MIAPSESKKKLYIGEKGFSYSLMTLFQGCRYKALLHVMGIHPKEKKVALSVGGFVHSLLEHGYPEENFNPETLLKDKGSQKEHEQLAFACAMVQAHREYWHDKEKHLRWVKKEHAFDTQINKFKVKGKVDALLRVKGKLWIYERKTTSGMRWGTLENEMHMNGQVLFYACSLEEEFQEKVRGFVYDFIQKPGHRKGKLSTQAYIDKVKGVILENPGKYNHRVEIAISRDRLKQYKKSLMYRFKEMTLWDCGLMDSPRNESQCVGKYGPCPYLQLCVSGRIDPEVYTTGKETEDGSKKEKRKVKRYKSARKA